MGNPWFRFYEESLDDPKVQKLPGDLFKIWVNALCLACRNDGNLPSIDDCSFAFRLAFHETKTAFHALTEAELFVTDGETFQIKNWNKRQYKSDTSTDRVKQHRKRKRNVTVTAPDTDTEQNRTDSDSEAVSWFSEQHLAQYRKLASDLTDDEFARAVSHCEIWLNAHGGKTPDLTLVKWLEREQAEKKKKESPWSPF